MKQNSTTPKKSTSRKKKDTVPEAPAAGQSQAPAPEAPDADAAPSVLRANNGTFAKGSARPAGAGRKAGTPNRTTQQLRNYMGYILDQEIESGRIEQALQDLFLDNPKLYLDTVLKIAPFYVPTLQSVELQGDLTVDDPFRAHMRDIAKLSQGIDSK